MQTPNKLEMGVVKLILARLRSKSPAMYATLTKIAGISAAVLAAYIGMYNSDTIPPHFVFFGKFDTGVLDNICVVFGAAMTALGLVSDFGSKPYSAKCETGGT